MMIRLLPLGALGITGVLALLGPASSGNSTVREGASAPSVSQGTDNMTRIENGLTSSKRSITSRMQTHRITGLSLVIVENNAIRYRRGYGLRVAGNNATSVSATTRFDGASLSKPLAAAAALRLVDQGRVGLTDTKVFGTIATKHMQPVQIPGYLKQFANPSEIDLSRLLMHCAGVVFQRQVSDLGKTGAQPFPLNSALPTIGQQLRGVSPAGATYKPVQTSAIKPGARFTYSGASYLLVEAIINAYSPSGFSAYTTELFRDLGMTATTFADYPLVSTVSAFRQSNQYARGHIRGATQAPRNYANHAAASVVTTAEDLARFLIMVNGNGVYNGRRVLSTAAIQRLTGTSSTADARCSNRTNAVRGKMGLGMWRHSSGTNHHRGTHGGFRTYMFSRPADRWAMAVMMTGDEDDATAFAGELFRAVEGVYGFPNGALPER